MRILLSNDDGIAAPGLEALVRALAPKHKVTIAAPMAEQSGMSHALTVGKRLYFAPDDKLEQAYAAHGVKAWQIGGTPTDCVMLYLEALADIKPDIVISGINHGANLGTDVLYSGTVGAAMEGWLHGLSAIAVSINHKTDIPLAEVADIFARQLDVFCAEEKPPFFLNVNFPLRFSAAGPSFTRTRLGVRNYKNIFSRHTDDEGKAYYLIGGDILDEESRRDTDVYAVQQGHIAVTPLFTDLTDYKRL